MSVKPPTELEAMLESIALVICNCTLLFSQGQVVDQVKCLKARLPKSKLILSFIIAIQNLFQRFHLTQNDVC